ncbi:hypothetical protein [Clostridium sp. YIM B02569]|uniref:hypothetical protein n=1 Tax=Clostridium sp. YIM B02569 TaxID=2911967 RepID=UPI001EEE3C12|nr:hypothetical protein [Clostridium sp. YIM B02569]
MAGKRAAKVPKNDFEYDEGEVCGFSSEAPLTGDDSHKITKKGNKHLMMFIAFNFKNIICYLLEVTPIFIH